MNRVSRKFIEAPAVTTAELYDEIARRSNLSRDIVKTVIKSYFSVIKDVLLCRFEYKMDGICRFRWKKSDAIPAMYRYNAGIRDYSEMPPKQGFYYPQVSMNPTLKNEIIKNTKFGEKWTHEEYCYWKENILGDRRININEYRWLEKEKEDLEDEED